MIKGLVCTGLVVGVGWYTYSLGYQRGEDAMRDQCQRVASLQWNEKASDLEATTLAAMQEVHRRIEQTRGQKFDFSDQALKSYLNNEPQKRN